MKRLIILLGSLVALLSVCGATPPLIVNGKASRYSPASFNSQTQAALSRAGKPAIQLIKVGGTVVDGEIGYYDRPEKSGPSAKRQRIPARKGSTGSTIYGWLTSYNDPAGEYPCVGLNEIDLNGTYTTLFNRNDGISGGGYVRNGNVCLYSIEAFYGIVMGAWYREFDMTTGEKKAEIEIPVYNDYWEADMSNIFVSFAYDPTEDMVYGYSYNEDGTGYLFSKASGNDPTNLSKIKTIDSSIYNEACRSMTYNSATGQLVGINIGGQMVEINKNTGDQTEMMSLSGISSLGEASGLVYSPVDQFYVWNTRDLNLDGYLLKLDPAGNVVEELVQYPYGELFAFFVCTDKAVDLTAPKEPVVKSNTFDGTPDLSGFITVTAPSVYEDGSDISGQLSVVASIDGEEYDENSVAPGADAVFEFNSLSEGKHSFLFSAKEGSKTGATARLSLYLGHDDPKAPAELWLDDTGIHWTPVTESENGGYIDLTQLQYDIALDEEMLAFNVTGDFYPYDFGDQVKSHIAQIQAVCNGKRSYVTTSPTYISGDALQLPVYFKPTPEDAAIMTVIDQNGDGTVWNYLADNSGNSYFAYRYDWTEPADDWIIFPAIDFPDASLLYTMSLDTWSDDWYPERFEVKIGSLPTITSMDADIFGPTEVLWSEPVSLERTFSVPAAGKYYIALHCISNSNMNELRINNIRIFQSTASKNGPTAVTDISAAETAPGELRAKVSFNMPVEFIAGEAIGSDVTIEATATSEAGSTSVSGTPGQLVSVEVPTVQGDNRISVQASVNGEAGLVDYVSVYTGVDIPGRVTNLEAAVSEDNMTVHLTWEPATIGENGGYVSPSGNTYMLMGMVPSDFGMRWGVIDEIGLDVFEYDYVLEPGTLQTEIELGVNVMNEADIASSFSRVKVAAGKPYELPMYDDFTDIMAKYVPVMLLVPSDDYKDTQWTVASPLMVDSKYNTETGGVLLGVSYSDAEVSKGRLMLPRFSTMGATNIQLTVEYAGDADLEVYANATGVAAPIFIGKISDMEKDASSVYNKFTFTLPAEFNNRMAVELLLDGVYTPDKSYAFIASYDIRNNVDYDFALSDISVPTSVEIGTEASFKAKVTNLGSKEQQLCSFKWQVLDGEKTVFEEVVPADASCVLAFGDSKELSTSFTPDADAIGNVTVVFSVEDDADQNIANNTVSANMRIGRGQQIVVTDLKGDVNDGKVALDWSLPISEFVVAGFEAETAFTPNPAVIQGFRNIDADGYDICGFSQWTCPNMFDPAAFTVWNAHDINDIIGTDGIYSASEGNQFLIAFCPNIDATVQPAADDWLISPEVLGATEVLVDIRPILYMYGAETVEFMVSTTDDEPESFSVLETVVIAGPDDAVTTWNTYAFSLPSDARYFAIHYVSVDKFGVQIDNIRYVTADNKSAVANFDIYRDDQLIEDNIEARGTYVDANAPSSGIHTYHVVPVKDDVRHHKSNTAVVDMGTGAIQTVSTTKGNVEVHGREGAIEIILADASETPVSVYNLAGLCLVNSGFSSERITVTIPAGIYMVKVADSVYKVVVR